MRLPSSLSKAILNKKKKKMRETKKNLNGVGKGSGCQKYHKTRILNAIKNSTMACTELEIHFSGVQLNHSN